jgi:hypothetical protein
MVAEPSGDRYARTAEGGNQAAPLRFATDAARFTRRYGGRTVIETVDRRWPDRVVQGDPSDGHLIAGRSFRDDRRTLAHIVPSMVFPEGPGGWRPDGLEGGERRSPERSPTSSANGSYTVRSGGRRLDGLAEGGCIEGVEADAHLPLWVFTGHTDNDAASSGLRRSEAAPYSNSSAICFSHGSAVGRLHTY